MEDPKRKAARKNLGRKNQGNEKYRLIWETLNQPILKYSYGSRNRMRPVEIQRYGQKPYRAELNPCCWNSRQGRMKFGNVTQ